jgi:hypothetical protein
VRTGYTSLSTCRSGPFLAAGSDEEASMTTPKPKKKRAREKQAKKHQHAHAAPGGTSGPIDRDVDESPEAVEERREAQSGPGATGVPHTGAGAADNPSPSDQAVDSVDDEHASRPHEAASAADDHATDEEADDVSFDPDASELREPERDKIDPHTRHER